MDACRASAAECRVKGLICQDSDLPVTPVRKGTKGPPAGVIQHSVAPFATAEIPGEFYPASQDFHLIARREGVTGKAGEEGFDARVYTANRAANKLNMDESKQRNYAGGGTPYATTQDIDRAEAFDRDFHLQETSRRLPDKIGSAAGFDPEAYRSQLAANQELHQSRQKKYGSSTGDDSSCPFATSDSDEFRQAWQRPDHHPKSQGRAMADKVGFQHSFDAELYSKNRERNKERQAESTQRNFVGGGDILSFCPSG